jgi:hypothetical protein
LDLYPLVVKRKLKNVDVEFKVEVGYWAFIDHLHDYKIYGTLIKMFKLGVSKYLATTTWK